MKSIRQNNQGRHEYEEIKPECLSKTLVFNSAKINLETENFKLAITRFNKSIKSPEYQAYVAKFASKIKDSLNIFLTNPKS